MKRTAFYIALFFPATLNCQTHLTNDTIHIREVVINKTDADPGYGFRLVSLDSAIIEDYTTKTLADLLAWNSAINVKSYGSGGLASPSIRGTGPGHTVLLWNGININNPMPGQSDISLVPAGFADNVIILSGAGSMELGGGGLGGSINLEMNPDWKKNNNFIINPHIGSFGRYSGLVKVKAGTFKFQSVTRAYLTYARNNFPYWNTLKGQEPVLEKRENSQIAQQGLVQEFYIKRNKGVISGRFWYQYASRNLPLPLSMLSMDTGERQEDQSFRSLLNYKTVSDNSGIDISAAYISDKLDYSNRLASVNSRNNVQSFILKSSAELPTGRLLRLTLGVDNELNRVNSNNYASAYVRNISAAHASALVSPLRWLSSNLLFRETLLDKVFLKPDISLGTKITLIPGREYYLKASFSRNSKVPALNDMYWQPGGNPNLRNETGIVSEIGFESKFDFISSFSVKTEITVFKNIIKDMIQWYPGKTSYWIAGNIGKVNTGGIESDLDVVYTGRLVRVHAHSTYAFTKASSVSITGNTKNETDQLIYVPENQLNSMIKVSWKRIFSSVRVNYISRRYITADNLQFLPGYSVSDLSLGANFNSGTFAGNLCFTLENIFDANYQNMAWYPMPGRACSITAIIKFKI